MNILSLCPQPEVFQGSRHKGHVKHGEAMPAAAEKRIDGWMAALAEAYERATGETVHLDKLPIERKRLLASLAENIKAHNRSAVSQGCPEAIFNCEEKLARRLGLKETVTTSDIATFTTQQLAYLVDVFAPFVVQDIFTTVTMTGPTAYIHRQRYSRSNAIVGAEGAELDSHYAIGTPLNEGLDPSYSECPTECTAANGIDVEITAELVTAECRRLAGKYCIPANYHVSSQYGGNLGSILMEGITIELRRAIQADLFTQLAAGAGHVRSWSRTPAAGSYFAAAHPREWKAELYLEIKAGNRSILSAADGRVSANVLVGDIAGLGVMEDIVPMEFVDQQPGNTFNGRLDEMTTFMGRTKADRYAVFRVLEGFPENTLVLMNRNDRDPTAVYAPWIPITSLGMLTNPTTASVEMGALTLYGSNILRPKRIVRININA